jgi:hypothetical protein
LLRRVEAAADHAHHEPCAHARPRPAAHHQLRGTRYSCFTTAGSWTSADAACHLCSATSRCTTVMPVQYMNKHSLHTQRLPMLQDTNDCLQLGSYNGLMCLNPKPLIWLNERVGAILQMVLGFAILDRSICLRSALSHFSMLHCALCTWLSWWPCSPAFFVTTGATSEQKHLREYTRHSESYVDRAPSCMPPSAPDPLWAYIKGFVTGSNLALHTIL